MLSGSLSTPSAKGAFFETHYESISTTTVSTEAVDTVTFSNIPTFYTHLQVRILARSTRPYGGNAVDGLNILANGTAFTKSHHMLGDGGSISAGIDYPIIFFPDDGAGIAGNYGGAIIDILDYSNLNKNKTFRGLAGFDNNTSSAPGSITLNSGFFGTTSAITSLTFTFQYGGIIKQHSQFALYGIRG